MDYKDKDVIKKSDKEENLKWTYNVFFYSILSKLRAELAFYDNETNYGSNRWEQLKSGNVPFGTTKGKKFEEFINIVARNTGIDKEILIGNKRMYLYADSSDDFAGKQEKKEMIEDEIKKIIEKFKSLNDEKKETIDIGKYSFEFRKLFEYLISIKNKPIIADKEIKDSLEQIKGIRISHFESADKKLLDEYFIILQEKIKVINAIQTINKLKEKE